MDWLLEKFPVLVFVVVAIAQVLRAVMKSRQARTDHERNFDETEEQRHIREVQEQIRRTVVARRQSADVPSPPMHETPEPPAPPILRREMETPGGSVERPARRGLVALERKVHAPISTEARSYELERQADLAEKMRQLAETRELAKRHAAQNAAAAEVAAKSEAGILTAGRTRLEQELRDPESLRRAFVLREILGPPVALR
jgi:hypothetical protein